MQIENAAYVPFTSRVMLERDEILDYIDELRAAIPEDISEASRIKDNEEKIRRQAKLEAGSMIRDAREQKNQLLEAQNITKQANQRAEDMIEQAESQVIRIQAKSMDYISELFTKAQEESKQALALMEENKRQLKEKKEDLLKVKKAQ